MARYAAGICPGQLASDDLPSEESNPRGQQHIQGYIPMVFSLPVTLLILADENRELGAKVYDQVMRDPFLGKAQLFKDIAYRFLPEEITSTPVKTVETSPQHREELWEAARKVLASWQDGTP